MVVRWPLVLRFLGTLALLQKEVCESPASSSLNEDSLVSLLQTQTAVVNGRTVEHVSQARLAQTTGLAAAEAVLVQDVRVAAWLGLYRKAVASTVANYIWLLGIPVSLLGSTITVTGLMMQKLAHEEEEKEPSCFYFLRWTWLVGIAYFGVGNFITWAALGMAPNSVLSCFNSWNIIYTLIIAPRWFKNEVISERTKYCAGVLVVGCCWVATAGPKSYRLQTVEHINSLFGYSAFQVCTVGLVVVYVATLVKYRYMRSQPDWTPITVVQIVASAAISASYAMMFAKCTSSLVQATLVTKHNEIRHQFFLYFCLTLVCGLSQIHFLNESVKHGDASFVVPVYESTAMAIQIVVGGILFHEYEDFSWQHHLCFWPGVLIVLCGIVALTKFAEEDKAEKTLSRLSAPAQD